MLRFTAAALMILLVAGPGQSQLTVTWNGTAITGPVLIYQDELVIDHRGDPEANPMDGTLICRAENQAQVGWHLPTERPVKSSSMYSFRQTRTSSTATPSVSRLSVNSEDISRDDDFTNGLWTCWLNEEHTNPTPISVGIYAREGGCGAISTVSVSLSSSSFLSDPPTFTLFGSTSGGPPTTYMWTRGSEEIYDDDTFATISVAVDEGRDERFQNSMYRSTLTVTGRLPGLYQYSVTNSATNNMVTGNFTIEAGAPPTDVAAVQTGLSTATVMWTPPPATPAAGYQVQVTGGDIDRIIANVSKTSRRVLINSLTEYGVYHIQVKSLSQHLPSEATGPVEVTIRGPLSPVISEPSPTGTSVTITWTQPEFSLPVANYTVTLTLSDDNIPGIEPQIQQMTTLPDVPTVTFRSLQPLSNYTVSVIANFQPEFGHSSLKRINTTEFTTLNAVSSSSSTAQIASAVIMIIIVAIVVIIVLLYFWKRHYKQLKFNLKSLNSKEPKFIYEEPVASEVLEKHNSKPVIEEFPADTIAIEGEGVFFQVIVKGRPQPSLTWYHQDTQLTPDYSLELQQDGSLSIISTELRHSGVYKLLAKNNRGSAERKVRLTVRQEEKEAAAVQVDKKKVELRPVPLAEFGDYVAQNHSNLDGGFKLQYHSLDTGDEHAKTVGTSKKYVKLNRFNNITVYDHNRIILSPLSDFVEYQQEFINACFIDGYINPQKFIATQGPKENILVDFWRLVWQEKPPTIVMVTNLKEGSKKKCEQYWPDDGRKNFGPFRVTLKEQQIFADYTIRTLHVTLERSTERALKVKQFQYTSWPDHGVPEYATSMLSFHRRVISQHKVNKGPILVHCSAGVGRTGTFICIDYVLEQTKKEKVVDIAGAINKMRHQRMMMVQTPEQYVFIHDAILESMTCGDTEISLADLKLAMTKLSKINQEGTTMFQTQFHVLDQVSPKQSEMVCSDALKHLKKNRCDQFLPSNKNRVILNGECPDYIHAVSANGYKQKKAYIIAEGPMASTTRNMWKVVYDRKCGVMVMLSDLVENGMESCFQYWPAVGRFAEFGEYKVKLVSEEPLEGFTIRTMSVLHEKTQKTHQVTQFHITCWKPDGQCSNLRAVVDVIEEVAKVQRRTGNKPMFIHCSDTVTRSGMFCAMATVIDRCKTEGVVDVFQVVKALRTSKPGAVPTEENYRTIFDATVTFLDSFDTYANFQN